jgi:hypothetical protein
MFQNKRSEQYALHGAQSASKTDSGWIVSYIGHKLDIREYADWESSSKG